ncbi:CDP-alcohol phosphatidyltransferase family protein [Tenacibaculum finnmarkense genomovar finnmarkense]|uniref:CDP-alcohol phosphatidyltransferase family protein n=1 Tax=Tenacibaculum finnmarkense TaxID=2781243 RepID=UPI001E453DF1|nr:CDP-alcohol phosphatidyltransferase family protein [Tenacibaculum finnmarkense]MCD8417900.1 CDP-alcohol phosphatidyltransferase family protein [Tenacibaculum finnmarkense genomovar finnmarkense]MCG8202816.1 CDP-alcohol phosphatidyltransferase family protein [Tenacibaculum finnmarkense genomovar finnmarkense]MCG8210864.1 CDP-alcohol phosphatidyltransferase family protein [Tenacibaculum finnmarkense genomovar finnmarkense]MCG8213055.1 CDP-alcohol phosphatidyltransferase family protein [Tenacib
MNIKKHIPNLLTLGNLLCGTIATIFSIKGDFVGVAFLVVLGIVFDFFDGFVARMLGVQGELGKQLDSLADMVTSGVVPGMVMLQLLVNALNVDAAGYFGIDTYGATGSSLPYIGLLLTLGACYRLANFNIDTRQSDSFIGLPTPAMALFVISLPLIAEFGKQEFFIEIIMNQYFLFAVTAVLTFLMNAEIPLFALKFKSFGFKENAFKYVFLAVCVLLLVVLKFVAIPLIILLYVAFSVVNNLKKA